MSTEKIPEVLVLGPIKPTSGSARAERLEYDGLARAVDKHRPHEQARMAEFWNAEEGSLEEQQAARQLAMQYMLMGALALNQSPRFADSLEVWSKRYTQAASELYGTPEAELARELWRQQQGGESVEALPFREAAEKVGAYLNETYQPVYEALDLATAPENIDPNSIADRFEAALKVLAESYDADWSKWTIERNEEESQLRVEPTEKKIIIGLERASVTPAQLKALFTHEVLIHGQRAVNGGKLSDEFGTGLPGYLEAEEGLGVFAEYAVSGTIKDVIIDRYVDIAYALGLIDGQPHTRQELRVHAMHRALKRNETADSKKSLEDVEKEVYAHVNRIYRGSLGDEHVGIFTKDIAYYKGFADMAQYVSDELSTGKSVDEVMTFVALGKFDPTNEQHVKFVEEAKANV